MAVLERTQATDDVAHEVGDPGQAPRGRVDLSTLRLRPLTWTLIMALVACCLLVTARMVMAANEAVLEANPTLNPLDSRVWLLPPKVYAALGNLQLPLLALTASAVWAWSWRCHRILTELGAPLRYPRHQLVWPWLVPFLNLYWPFRSVRELHRLSCSLGAPPRRYQLIVPWLWWGSWVVAIGSAFAFEGLRRLEFHKPGLIDHLVIGGALLGAAAMLMVVVEDVQRRLRAFT